MARFIATRGHLTAVLELFIASNCDALVWDLSISSTSQEALALDVFGYVEFSLLDWNQDTGWACYVKHNLETFFDEHSQAIIYLYRHFHFNPRLAECPLVFFGSSEPIASWCGERELFTGDYRDERNPAAVEQGRCPNAGTLCGDPCAALHCGILIPPSGRKNLRFFLGGAPHAVVAWPRALETARSIISELRQPGRVESLRNDLRAWWDRHFSVLQTRLPDSDVQRQINTWTPVQIVHTGRYSRSVSQHAAGIRTLGYRDTCQDMLAIAPRNPDWAGEIFLYLISQQYEDGHTPHQCNPAEQLPAEPRIHIDNPLWLPLLAHALVAETGEVSLLEKKVPWLSARDNISPTGSATVWEHLLRISDFIEANLGSHGIPLIHHGDWNDSIGKFGKKGRGQSLMAAMQYVHALRLLEELAGLTGDSSSARRLCALRAKQSQAILDCGWDGAWWRRGYDDDGQPIGSATCPYGKIWLNTQTWAVIAQIGSSNQQLQALDSVAQLLDTGICGLRKLTPSFPSFPEVQDPYSGYSPGCGENGAIFCHANTWAIIAEALLGRPERAWHYYRQLLPHLALQKLGLTRYRAEPYAYVSNIIGPENPKFGWANVTQVTGTAAWMEIAATQYLIGFRPELEGMRISPCLPPDWDGFSATRQFRGAVLNLSVRRGESASLLLDGTPLTSNLIPSSSLKRGSTHQIDCVLPR